MDHLCGSWSTVHDGAAAATRITAVATGPDGASHDRNGSRPLGLGICHRGLHHNRSLWSHSGAWIPAGVIDGCAGDGLRDHRRAGHAIATGDRRVRLRLPAVPRMSLAIPVAGVVSECSLLISQITVAEPVINKTVAVVWCRERTATVMVAAKQPAERAQQQAATTGGGGLSREQDCGNCQQQRTDMNTHRSLPQTDRKDGGHVIGGLPRGSATRPPSDEGRLKR